MLACARTAKISGVYAAALAFVDSDYRPSPRRQSGAELKIPPPKRDDNAPGLPVKRCMVRVIDETALLAAMQ